MALDINFVLLLLVVVVTAPAHRGMARLSGADWPGKYLE